LIYHQQNNSDTYKNHTVEGSCPTIQGSQKQNVEKKFDFIGSFWVCPVILGLIEYERLFDERVSIHPRFQSINGIKRKSFAHSLSRKLNDDEIEILICVSVF
jgi:hypothetical protein